MLRRTRLKDLYTVPTVLWRTVALSEVRVVPGTTPKVKKYNCLLPRKCRSLPTRLTRKRIGKGSGYVRGPWMAGGQINKEETLLVMRTAVLQPSVEVCPVEVCRQSHLVSTMTARRGTAPFPPFYKKARDPHGYIRNKVVFLEYL